MIDLRLLDAFRVRNTIVDRSCLPLSKEGAFILKSPIDGGDLRIIASVGDGWDHVSVSRATRCPNWEEMEHVARHFFRSDEVAMQLHVPTRDHINYHPHCLHWWRPLTGEIPRPPNDLVGAP